MTKFVPIIVVLPSDANTLIWPTAGHDRRALW